MTRWTWILLIGVLLITLPACRQTSEWSPLNQVQFTTTYLTHSDDICLVPTSASSTNFFVLLGAGLLIGLSHCVGMCGPLVGAFTVRRKAENREISTPLTLFQMGRITTYMGLGLLLGSTGYLFTTIIQAWQGLIAFGIGLLIIGLGLSLLGLIPFQRWLASLAPTRWVSNQLSQLMGSKYPAAPFGLGMINGLLPCGPVYALGLLASATQSPLQGALLMLIFGLGTLPALIGFGLSMSLLSIQFRRYIYRFAAIAVIFVGLQQALRGLAFSGQLSHVMIGGEMLW
ncbi:MAG: sulfite exporter TauE/SafE family protein [Chloroflexota bacterium]